VDLLSQTIMKLIYQPPFINYFLLLFSDDLHVPLEVLFIMVQFLDVLVVFFSVGFYEFGQVLSGGVVGGGFFNK
jgi:hypothetical protein